MSLQDELTALLRTGYRELPAASREVMERAGKELAASGLASRALRTGDSAPRFSLPTATGDTVSLHALLSAGPVVLTFYRGAWCPYCNLALRALQAHHADISARGAQLVAISPQVPDESLTLTEKHSLAFDVLSDIGSDTAKQFGISFDLPDDLAVVYESFGFDLQRVNGGHPRSLPVPATYVIDRDGTIRWSFLDTDYTARAEPSDILSALDALPAAP
ncbi:peroxiredoxin [Streptomyces glebosus]|uniref:thioredoxin-dependent peroxiredoxin n=1 Tax=Streptomyces glebosus TaxID=249580 RepID=A0A640T057_9ACTN|nr:peroxiredoxin-like family protein [Streptomyces glebosus]GFE15666.1 peroxiredoxin [Streptomyces glebosus]GHG51953.1 peroxiredoxin [Streptomyces glebosus]